MVADRKVYKWEINLNFIRKMSIQPKSNQGQERKIPQFYTVAEVANSLSVTKHTVYKWLKGGILSSFRVGDIIRIKEQDLLDLIEEGKLTNEFVPRDEDIRNARAYFGRLNQLIKETKTGAKFFDSLNPLIWLEDFSQNFLYGCETRRRTEEFGLEKVFAYSPKTWSVGNFKTSILFHLNRGFSCYYFPSQEGESFAIRDEDYGVSESGILDDPKSCLKKYEDIKSRSREIDVDKLGFLVLKRRKRVS